MDTLPCAILACGLSTYDLIYYTDDFPASNQKITADSAIFGAGGPALNAAITAAQLQASDSGVESPVPVKLVSSVGHGEFADLIRSECTRFHVELLDHAPAGARPPISSVVVNGNAERSVVSLNAQGHEQAALSAEQAEAACADARILLIDGHHLSLAGPLVHAAHLTGIPVVLDGGSWKPGLEELLPMVDIAAVSADFVPPLKLADYGIRWELRTRGSAPVQIFDHHLGHHDYITPVAPASVVDTLGAGDVFHGALVYALAQHVTTDPPLTWEQLLDAATQATQVASVSVTHQGARLHL